MLNKHKRLFKLATLPAFLLSSYANASGIQLDTSYPTAGYAWAGRAALFDDASTGYYNPALYSAFCHPEVGITTMFAEVNPDIKRIEATIDATALGINPIIQVEGNDRTAIGGWAILGGLHAVVPLPYRFSVGLNIALPWGLSLESPRSSRARYFAQKGSVKVLDIDPGVSYEIIDGLSVGAALDATYTRAETSLTIPTFVGTGNPPVNPPFTQGSDTHVKNENGEKWAFGWNAGILYRAPTGTNIGVGYHSRINVTTEGSSSAIDGITAIETHGHAETALILPAFFNVSVVQAINPCWEILGDIRFTNWSKLDKATIKFDGDVATAVDDVVLDLKWQDSLAYAIGVGYKPREEWKLKAGIGYDETPIRNDHLRPFLIPDNNRYVIGLGAQYCINRNFHLDAGYTMKILGDSDIHATRVAGPVILTADAEVRTLINEFSLSLNWTII